MAIERLRELLRALADGPRSLVELGTDGRTVRAAEKRGLVMVYEGHMAMLTELGEAQLKLLEVD